MQHSFRYDLSLKLRKGYDSSVLLKEIDGGKTVLHIFLLLAPEVGFRAKNKGKLIFSPFTSLAGCIGCVGAGLTLTNEK